MSVISHFSSKFTDFLKQVPVVLELPCWQLLGSFTVQWFAGRSSLKGKTKEVHCAFRVVEELVRGNVIFALFDQEWTRLSGDILLVSSICWLPKKYRTRRRFSIIGVLHKYLQPLKSFQLHLLKSPVFSSTMLVSYFVQPFFHPDTSHLYISKITL